MQSTRTHNACHIMNKVYHSEWAIATLWHEVGVAKWMSLDKLYMIKREIASVVGVARLECVLGCAELVVSVDEEGQYCF